jgi:hypothetical protein
MANANREAATTEALSKAKEKMSVKRHRREGP